MSDLEPGATPDPEAVDPIAPEDPAETPPPADEKPDLVKDLVEQRKAWRAEKATLKARLEALEAEAADRDKPADEQAIERAKREARTEAQVAFNQRLVSAELKAALAGKVNDTVLALKVIDTSAIDVSDDGEVDPQSVTDAIEAALSAYPVLRTPEQKKFPGTADQGPKNSARPPQLTREQLKSLSAEQIIEAEAKGQLDSILGGKA